MSDLNYSNYLESAESKLLTQFREKPRIKGLLLSVLKPLQSTQDSLIEYAENNNLETGTGRVLDVIGKIVGESRSGRSDTSYREALYNRIVINVSEGTPNQLLEILTLLSKGTEYKIFEHFPLTTAFYTNGVASSSLAKTLYSASPVTSDVVSVYHDPDEDAWIPSELETDLGILVDETGREITDDESRNIAVTYLTTAGVDNSEKGVCPEIGDEGRNPCEVYR